MQAKLVPGAPGQLDVVVNGTVLEAKPQGFWGRLLSSGPDETLVVQQLREHLAAGG